jgi:4-amino-4-deoxy-L-arabinose transferase-like glycosyltransferase
LASTLLFCAAAHFANPDALLNAFTVLALLAFWVGYDSGWRGWPVPAGIATGLAMLAKGPVGLVMPGAAVLLFLLWQRRLRFLWASRLVLGTLAFILVAVPWYAWVGAETKAEFLQGFFLKHNVGRYLSPMENHRGPIFYYVVVLMLGFLPWSVFLVPAAWDLLRSWRAGGVSPRREQTPENDPLPALRFLCCWIAVYLVFFSLSRTKLPNYVLPVYAPTAILTARFLHRWRGGLVSSPGWVLKAGLVALALVGVGLAAGLLLAGGVVEAPFVRRRLPGLEAWAAVGLLPVLGAASAWWFLRREDRPAFVSCFTATALLFVGLIGAHGGITLDCHKAPKPLARLIESEAGERDVRIAAYGYFQPSLVFYCRREVQRLEGEGEVLEFLRYPVPVYLVVPAPAWERLKPKVDSPCRLLGRCRDLYRNCDVVVVANQPPAALAE